MISNADDTVYDKLRHEQPNNARGVDHHHHHHHDPLKMLSKLFRKRASHAAEKAPALSAQNDHSHKSPSSYTYKLPSHYTQWSVEAGNPPPMPPLPKKIGLFARLFAHDHSKGSQGALVVEGVDEGVHPFSNAAATAHLAAAPPPQADTSAYTHLQDIGSTPLHSAIGGASIGVSSIIDPIGIYTVAISAHEMHEEKHAEKGAAEQAGQFERSARRYEKFLENENLDTGTRETVGAVASAYAGLLRHIRHTQQQAKIRFRFWGSSLTSGAAATANSTTIIGTTVAGTAVGAAVGGVAALFLPLVGGVATTALGHYHTKGARKDRDYLRTVAPMVLDALNQFEANEEIKNNPVATPYAYFLREKFPQRDDANKRDVRWGKVFTGGAAVGTAGALTGGLVGFGVGLAAAAPTFGASVPVCTAIGAAIGGAGGLVAAGSAPILPIRHTKSGRHDRCAKLDPAQREEVQEAVFRAAADVLEPKASFLLRASEFNDIGSKNRHAQTMLNLIAMHPAIRKNYQPETHKSDIPSASPAERLARTPTTRWRKLRKSDIRRFVQDPDNFSVLCEYMRKQIDVAVQPKSSLRAKIQLQQDVFGKLSSNAEVVDLVKLDFQDMVQRDERAIGNAANLRDGLTKLLAPENPRISEDWQRHAMRIYLLHNGIQTHDVYDGMAEHLHESGKRDREAREKIFHAEWRSGLMKLHQRGEEVPAADGNAAKSRAIAALANARSSNQEVRNQRATLSTNLHDLGQCEHPNYFESWERDRTAAPAVPENATVSATNGIPLWEYHYGHFGTHGTFTQVTSDERKIRFGRDVIPKEELAAASGLDVDAIDALINKKGTIKRSSDDQHRLDIMVATQDQELPEPRSR